MGHRESDLPMAMAELAEDFQSVSAKERLQILLELADGVPELPERYAGNLDKLERVDECQSPVFVIAELRDDGFRTVRLYFEAPDEAPTTKGFAGILYESLDGLPAQSVLDVPDDAPFRFGLAEAVSPLRMRGMVGMLSRIKRQVALRLESDATSVANEEQS
ncbi:SufE family protein [Ornithinimicrobium sp. INDO-MA30-4]|uniref:SufE family protein n=1 Tax=Ornithinimicrobium sp. INDO-MA30-4 TaxID=2908651 RepID=UPI001F436F52|nr:SufE family protein [Ornithinimicrobium sp. INDO-MA30-4]UJH71143.1 SufE family protein [Ornithinimicrobium sp. INDO-MA30-4]